MLQQKRTIGSREFLILLLCLIAGMVIAMVLTHYLFNYTKGPGGRPHAIRQAIDGHPDKGPEVVILGNSVALSLDARRISRQLDHQPLVWNLASAGQSLLEAMLLETELPASVETMLFCLEPVHLFEPVGVNYQKYIAWHHNGFRFTTTHKDLLSGLHVPNLAKCLESSSFQIELDKRFVIPTAFNFYLTGFIRSDLNIEKARRDLFLPYAYSKELREPVLERKLQLFHEKFSSTAIDIDRLKLMQRIYHHSRKNGRRIIFVLLPQHPGLNASKGALWFRNLSNAVDTGLLAKDIPVLNFHSLLEREDFIDPMHFDVNGGNKVIDSLVSALTR